MAPEILVVGDVAAQQPLWYSIEDRGYEVLLCMEQEVAGRLAKSPLPAAMVLSMDGTDYAAVLSQCRRHPEGASLPVVLLAHAQGPVGSLADLIELGADQVLYAPVDPKLLAQALLSLAGPGQEMPAVPQPCSPRRPRVSGRRRSAAAAGTSKEKPSARPAFAASLAQHAPAAVEFAPAPAESISPDVSDKFHLPEARAPEHDFAWASDLEQDREEDRALDALVAEERAIQRDLAAFRLQDLPRIEDPSPGFDPRDAEAGLFGAPEPQSHPERTSTQLGRPVQSPPPPPPSDPGLYGHRDDPAGHTAEIPRDEIPARARLRTGQQSSRGELARLARRLENRGEGPVESAGHETIRIKSRYSVSAEPGSEFRSELTTSGPFNGQRQGLLSQLEVPRLLWELSEARFDGVLDLTSCDDTSLRIAWRAGLIRTVKGSEEGDSLPASLWRRLLLTKAQYEELCSIPSNAQVPETMVAHLVRRGWLSGEEQSSALSHWIEDTVLRWWTVGSGRWKLTPDSDHWLCKQGKSNWDVASVFLSACIQQVTPALARLWMGERSYAPQIKFNRVDSGLSPEAWIAQRFGASPMVRQWLTSADGRPIEVLEEQLGWQQRYGGSSMGLCYALEVLDLIELPELASQQAARTHALLRERLSARLSLALSGTYFEFLGLSNQASSAQADLASQNLREALRRIEQDPVKLAPVEDLVLALKENLQAAQRVLGDEDARAMYLRTRTEGSV